MVDVSPTLFIKLTISSTASESACFVFVTNQGKGMNKKQSQVTDNALSLGIIYPDSAGIDVGSMNMMLSFTGIDGKQVVKEFSAYTDDLEAIAAELKAAKMSRVGMEATGVYWMALYDVLEKAGFEVSLVNARNYRNVDGQKTDVKDCQWLQQLHAHGLLRASHIATEQYRQLRIFIHERSLLLKSKSDTLNRIQKVLSQMNIKVQHLISDIEGVAASKIISRIADGVTDPEQLLKGVNIEPLKAGREELIKSLKGITTPYYAAVLKMHLDSCAFYRQQMLKYELLIEALLKEMQSAEQREQPVDKKTTKARKGNYHFNVRQYLHRIAGVDLTKIPGLDESTILTIISVVGLDMKKWPTADHFTSWLNLAARPKISGGKVIGSQKRFTNNPATQAFRQAAQTMWRHKGTLGHLYRRLCASKGSQKAIKAVARRLAMIFYTMVKNQTAYDPAKVAMDDEQIRQRKISRLRAEAKKLGYKLDTLAT